MSKSKELELIKKGRAKGYTNEQCVSVVKLYRHKQWVAAERKRLEAERVKYIEELKEKHRVDQSTVKKRFKLDDWEGQNKNWDEEKVYDPSANDGEGGYVTQSPEYFKGCLLYTSPSPRD